jgi:hypothetical protein
LVFSHGERKKNACKRGFDFDMLRTGRADLEGDSPIFGVSVGDEAKIGTVPDLFFGRS